MTKQRHSADHSYPEVLDIDNRSIFSDLLSAVGSQKKKIGVFFVVNDVLDPWLIDMRLGNSMSLEMHYTVYDILKQHIQRLKEIKKINQEMYWGMFSIDTNLVEPNFAQKYIALPLHIDRDDCIIGFNGLPTIIKNSRLSQQVGEAHLRSLPLDRKSLEDDNLSAKDVDVLKNEPVLKTPNSSSIFLPGVTPHQARISTLGETFQRVFFQINIYVGRPEIVSPL